MGFGIAVSLLVKCCLCEDMHLFLPYGGRKIEYIVVVPSIGVEVMLRVDSVPFTGCQKGGSGAIAALRLWQPASGSPPLLFLGPIKQNEEVNGKQ